MSTWELLDWDTQHFGFPTAQIRAGSAPEDVAQDLPAMRAAGIALAYYATPAAGVEARLPGARQVDIKTTYAATVQAVLQATDAAGVSTREARAPMTPAWRELALEAGAYSRFRVDPRFPRPLFESMFSRWMDRSLAHEIAAAVYVTEDAAGPTGIVTVGPKAGRADVGLIAVSARARGQGLARGLVRRAAEWAQASGLSEAQVVTQGANAAACRLYEACGYRVETAVTIYHLWL